MKKNQEQPRTDQPSGSPSNDRRPAYEPPRIVKKRSVARVTLLTGGGPPAGGLTAAG